MKRLLLNKIAFLRKNPYVPLILCAFIILIASLGIPLKDFVGGCGSDDSSEDNVADMAERDEIERILSDENQDEAGKLGAIKSLVSSGATICSEAQRVVPEGSEAIEVTNGEHETRVSAGGKEFRFVNNSFPTVTLSDGRPLFTQIPKLNIIMDGKSVETSGGSIIVRKMCPRIVRLYYHTYIYHNVGVSVFIDIEPNGMYKAETRIASYPKREIKLDYLFNIKKYRELSSVSEVRYDSENLRLIMGEGSTEEVIPQGRSELSFSEVVYLKSGNIGFGLIPEMCSVGNRLPIVIDNIREEDATLSIKPCGTPVTINKGVSLRNTISFLIEEITNNYCWLDRHCDDSDPYSYDYCNEGECINRAVQGEGNRINILESNEPHIFGDGRIETSAIQDVIDSASPGSVIFFPPVPNNYYAIDRPLRLDKPLTITGSGKNSGSWIHQTIINQHAFDVVSSGVTIAGMKITGTDYGPHDRGNYGIYAHGSNKDNPISGITIADCHIQTWSGGGIQLKHVYDFIVSENHIEDCTYSGVFIYSSKRGLITDNFIRDIGSNEIPYPEGASDIVPFFDYRENRVKNLYVNAYPIVTTGDNTGNAPYCEDILIRNNTVLESPQWVGIMNHGGDRILIHDNNVQDASFLYANTSAVYYNGVDECSDNTVFINNIGDILPSNAGGRYDPRHGDGQWFISNPSCATIGVMAIGNIYKNVMDVNAGVGTASCIYSMSASGARFTWNKCEGSQVSSGVRLQTRDDRRDDNISYEDLVIAHNTFVSPKNQAVYSESAIVSSAIVEGNRIETGPTQFGINILNNGNWDIAQHEFEREGTVPINGNYEAVNLEPHFMPSIPENFRAEYIGLKDGYHAVKLSWIYPENNVHDSFYIEQSRSLDGPWERLAFRPPNRSMWKFNAPENLSWVQFNPLTHLVSGLSPNTQYFFRIRANNAESFSRWSNTATVIMQ